MQFCVNIRFVTFIHKYAGSSAVYFRIVMSEKWGAHVLANDAADWRIV